MCIQLQIHQGKANDIEMHFVMRMLTSSLLFLQPHNQTEATRCFRFPSEPLRLQMVPVNCSMCQKHSFSALIYLSSEYAIRTRFLKYAVVFLLHESVCIGGRWIQRILEISGTTQLSGHWMKGNVRPVKCRGRIKWQLAGDVSGSDKRVWLN